MLQPRFCWRDSAVLNTLRNLRLKYAPMNPVIVSHGHWQRLIQRHHCRALYLLLTLLHGLGGCIALWHDDTGRKRSARTRYAARHIVSDRRLIKQWIILNARRK